MWETQSTPEWVQLCKKQPRGDKGKFGDSYIYPHPSKKNLCCLQMIHDEDTNVSFQVREKE